MPLPLTITFRTAALDDVALLLELIHAGYRGDESRKGWTTEADLLDGQRTDVEAITDIISGGTGRMIMCEENGELLGCCQLERRTDGNAYFGMFSVWPHLQGRGAGKAIVGDAERVARDEWNAHELRMYVIEQRDDLIVRYERLGYHRTGETEPFPYGDERFGLPKRDDLSFIVLSKTL